LVICWVVVRSRDEGRRHAEEAGWAALGWLGIFPRLWRCLNVPYREVAQSTENSVRHPVPSLDTALRAEKPEVTMCLAVPLLVQVLYVRTNRYLLRFPLGVRTWYLMESFIRRSALFGTRTVLYMYGVQRYASSFYICRLTIDAFDLYLFSIVLCTGMSCFGTRYGVLASVFVFRL
jgi:hypothetical protein